MSEKRILYVEDDLTLSYLTIDNLQLKGYSITHFTDGLSALSAFKSTVFDICILDVMLPKMDGFTLARKIRMLNTDIPIIFLTAKALKEDKISGLKLGGDDYIIKPFSIEELVLKIEIFLKRNKVNQDFRMKTNYNIGKYNLDYKNYILSIENNQQKLTQKEANLIRLFAENINHTLKREDILNQLWGNDDYFMGRSLDVFISRLRKYLKADSSINIENVHSIGFRLRIPD